MACRGLIPLGKLRKYRSAVRNTVGLYTYLFGMWLLRQGGSLLLWSTRLYFDRRQLLESLSLLLTSKAGNSVG